MLKGFSSLMTSCIDFPYILVHAYLLND